jgi:uncharacterized protein (TIGR00730 family)
MTPDPPHRPPEGTSSALALEDPAFLESEAARPLRIIAEYLKPMAAFQRARVHDTVVFFGSARLTREGPLGHYLQEAQELARSLTAWSCCLPSGAHRFVICSGGGGGIMEAANRGAREAGGRTVGLNISLPHEQRANPYITPGLGFEFRYFFMRKLWFAHLARALVVFPGGFGTLDELTEILTLAQTRKLEHRTAIVLYGSAFWREVINFDALVRFGLIAPEDLELFQFADDPAAALAMLQAALAGVPEPAAPEAAAPAFARSLCRAEGG